jgi:hypothetical protein
MPKADVARKYRSTTWTSGMISILKFVSSHFRALIFGNPWDGVPRENLMYLDLRL